MQSSNITTEQQHQQQHNKKLDCVYSCQLLEATGLPSNSLSQFSLQFITKDDIVKIEKFFEEKKKKKKSDDKNINSNDNNDSSGGLHINTNFSNSNIQNVKNENHLHQSSFQTVSNVLEFLVKNNKQQKQENFFECPSVSSDSVLSDYRGRYCPSRMKDVVFSANTTRRTNDVELILVRLLRSKTRGAHDGYKNVEEEQYEDDEDEEESALLVVDDDEHEQGKHKNHHKKSSSTTKTKILCPIHDRDELLQIKHQIEGEKKLFQRRQQQKEEFGKRIITGDEHDQDHEEEENVVLASTTTSAQDEEDKLNQALAIVNTENETCFCSRSLFQEEELLFAATCSIGQRFSTYGAKWLNLYRFVPGEDSSSSSSSSLWNKLEENNNNTNNHPEIQVKIAWSSHGSAFHNATLVDTPTTQYMHRNFFVASSTSSSQQQQHQQDESHNTQYSKNDSMASSTNEGVSNILEDLVDNVSKNKEKQGKQENVVASSTPSVVATSILNKTSNVIVGKEEKEGKDEGEEKNEQQQQEENKKFEKVESKNSNNNNNSNVSTSQQQQQELQSTLTSGLSRLESVLSNFASNFHARLSNIETRVQVIEKRQQNLISLVQYQTPTQQQINSMTSPTASFSPNTQHRISAENASQQNSVGELLLQQLQREQQILDMHQQNSGNSGNSNNNSFSSSTTSASSSLSNSLRKSISNENNNTNSSRINQNKPPTYSKTTNIHATSTTNKKTTTKFQDPSQRVSSATTSNIKQPQNSNKNSTITTTKNQKDDDGERDVVEFEIVRNNNISSTTSSSTSRPIRRTQVAGGVVQQNSALRSIYQQPTRLSQEDEHRLSGFMPSNGTPYRNSLSASGTANTSNSKNNNNNNNNTSNSSNNNKNPDYLKQGYGMHTHRAVSQQAAARVVAKEEDELLDVVRVVPMRALSKEGEN